MNLSHSLWRENLNLDILKITFISALFPVYRKQIKCSTILMRWLWLLLVFAILCFGNSPSNGLKRDLISLFFKYLKLFLPLYQHTLGWIPPAHEREKTHGSNTGKLGENGTPKHWVIPLFSSKWLGFGRGLGEFKNEKWVCPSFLIVDRALMGPYYKRKRSWIPKWCPLQPFLELDWALIQMNLNLAWPLAI